LEATAIHGVLVVDKPAGPTSHDVVDRVRKALGVRRVGHTGTLDPFATGVLPVCVGKATRLARFLAEGDKAYRATVRLGFATTTDDLTGEPLTEARPVSVTDATVRRVCASLLGDLLQVPPAYSAKRVEGRRMYALARRGRAGGPLLGRHVRSRAGPRPRRGAGYRRPSHCAAPHRGRRLRARGGAAVGRS
jgi:tRNA pseudouridine55 synthase